jgi:hypothetical protein
MMTMRQQQHQQQQHHQQHQAGMAGTQSSFLQWSMPERGEATLQDFMEQQTNTASALMPTPLARYWHDCPIAGSCTCLGKCTLTISISLEKLIFRFDLFCYSREVPSSGETNPTGFFGSASQSNLQSLGHINILGTSRGLNIHDITMDQSSAQYDDQKKAKLEVNIPYGQSTSNGTTTEAATESYTHQSENGSATASNWHQAHHHAQAYTSAQYPSQYFTQVLQPCTVNRVLKLFCSLFHVLIDSFIDFFDALPIAQGSLSRADRWCMEVKRICFNLEKNFRSGPVEDYRTGFKKWRCPLDLWRSYVAESILMVVEWQIDVSNNQKFEICARSDGGDQWVCFSDSNYQNLFRHLALRSTGQPASPSCTMININSC